MNAIQQINYGGLVIAFSGFGITRLFVAKTLQIDTTLPFLIVGLVPLVVGLVLTVYGVALAIGPFDARYVNTVASWHVLGVGSMILVFAITAVDQSIRTGSAGFGYDAPLLVANVLLGGAVGGTLTGLRAGRLNRQRRMIQRSADRTLLINRLLRHEVLNAVTIIGGHATLLSDENDTRNRSMTAIQQAVQRIKSTIEEVGTLTRDNDWSKPVDVATIVRTETDRIEAEHGIDISLSVNAEDTEIRADDRLTIVVRELLENAVAHGGSDVSVVVDATPQLVECSITNTGSGLSESEQVFLTRADTEFPDTDDTTVEFGHQIVRLLTLQFGGRIRVRDAARDGDTTITVAFPRSGNAELTTETVALSFPNLTRALTAGLLGGVAMGIFYQFSTGLLPVIGSLYGIETPLIGWITHLFHSAVFGLVFAALSAAPRIDRFVSGPFGSGLVGLGWGAVLWFFAAGILMPLWLSLLGVPASIPNLSIPGFVGHAIWGVALGVSYWGLKRLDIGARLRSTS